ncbi:MAG: serine--tRNA ligase [Candidatus Pacearchaeota archaeon]|nr:MAG: serine--tRNA ligase [Candidatus Pacearchaeota archaeon]
MIDLKDLRERPEVYIENIKKKGQDPNIVSETLILDKKWREAKKRADYLRKKRNEISQEINEAKKQKKRIDELLKKAKALPNQIREAETEEKEIFTDLQSFLSKIPNLMHKDVPIGKSEKDNVVVKNVGKPKKLNFNVKNHVEISESLNLVDFDASAEVAGTGFYYLKGDLALLNQALIKFTIDFMLKKGYTYLEPPLMIRKKIAIAQGDFEAFKNALYKIEGEDLYLIPTAEHAILGMLSNKQIPEEKLPLRFFGYSMCFRKEIGSHGINEKGLWRTHQFNKVEQFIFCKPENSWECYSELMKNSEEILKKLKLPYRIIEICSAELGNWKARSHDFEVWRPTLKTYGEVMSLSNCTDYQSRELNIRGIRKNGERFFLHTLNNTALATSRIMVAILENYQKKDGSVEIPEAIRKYMNGKKIIKPSN